MEISRRVALFLKDFCSQVHVSDVPRIEAVGCTSNKRRKHSADYRIFVGKPSHANLQPHLQRLVHELLSASASWTVPLRDCQIMSPVYLEFSLNRAAAYRSLFSFILDKREANDKQQKLGSGENVLIFVPHPDESFTGIRTEMLAAYASRCYADRNVGVTIYASKPLHALRQHSFDNLITCDDGFQSGTHRNDMTSVTACRKFFDEGNTTFDLKSYVVSEGIDVGHTVYLGKVSIESPAFAIARQLAYILKNRCDTEFSTVLVVIPASKGFVVQQAGLLYTIMIPQDQRSKPQPTVLYLIHEGSYELSDCTFEDYLQQRRTFVMGAFHRPQADLLASTEGCSFEDESAVTSDNLQAAIEVLVETEVAYEFLSSKQNVKLKLCERLSHAEKGHYFSQYTLARIAAILDKYESSVKAGTYPALCRLEDVDFDLLCEESEWQLWHRLLLCWQVLQEPMPQTLPDSIKVEVNAHTLLRALEALCTEFSAYYSKVRVLVHPEPHLNATVFARIWLIRAVQKTVLCMLDRFGLKGLDRM